MINYAERYSTVVDERFRLGALTNGMDNFDYDWVGVETVQVFSIPTVGMNNYSLTGSSRYGTPSELENVLQELKVEQDRSFTFTIDRKSVDDTQGVMAAGSALARQIDEVAIPEIDTYKLGKAAIGAAHPVICTSSPYADLLTAGEALDDDKVPAAGRVAYVTPAFYNALKLDDNFIKKGDMSQQISINGVVGEADGVIIVKAPTSYFPSGVKFVMCLLGSIPSPIKLMDYKIHDNPAGINGFLVEGRLRYDAFILTNKACSIAVGVGSTVSAIIFPDSPVIRTTDALTMKAAPMVDVAGGTLAWTSATTATATINQTTGVVTPAAAGTTIIKAEWKQGNTVLASAQTTLTVV